jgi:ribose transport system ATP-binding protein
MLAGAERPDHGEMQLDGARYAPADSTEAAARGVALVFQEITVNKSLTVAENIFIDRLRQFSTRFGLISSRRLNAAAQSILDRLGVPISVSSDIERLNLGEWKCIEIARALSTEPKVLLLDESTAYLGRSEVDSVLSSIRQLKKEGITIAFVSHHLEEVREVADELTILKDGEFAGTFRTDEIEADEVHRRMVGREVSLSLYPKRPAEPDIAAPAVFAARDLACAPDLAGVRLEVRAGEILGLAGLKGSGADGLFAAISGDCRPRCGEMLLNQASYAPESPADAWRNGVAHLPGDRGGEGLIVEFSVMDNLVMARPPRRGPFFDGREAAKLSQAMVGTIGIKTAGIHAACRSLSGGNLQKVVLGKCIAVAPRLLLLNNPTRGVDIGARMEIYRAVRELTAQGLAIILSSEDMAELIGLSDRLLVLKQGRIVHRFERAAGILEHDIVRYMT